MLQETCCALLGSLPITPTPPLLTPPSHPSSTPLLTMLAIWSIQTSPRNPRASHLCCQITLSGSLLHILSHFAWCSRTPTNGRPPFAPHARGRERSVQFPWCPHPPRETTRSHAINCICRVWRTEVPFYACIPKVSVRGEGKEKKLRAEKKFMLWP